MKNVPSIIRAIYFALRLLINPANSKALLKLGNLLSQTKAFDACLERAKADPEARELIKARFRTQFPELSKLETYSENSLGRAYYLHMKKNNLRCYEVPANANFTEAEYLRERQREIHDILHALFDLGIDPSSEGAVNAFVMAQIYSPISTLIVVWASIHVLFTEPRNLSAHFESVFKFWKMGKHSKSIFSIKWENILGTSMAQLRNEWGVSD